MKAIHTKNVAYKLGLLGLGTVGAGVAEIVTTPTGRHPLLAEVELARVGVRDLSKVRALDASLLTTDLESIVTDPTIDMVIELIGGLEPARSLILTAIANQKHVITANKAVIARYGTEILAAAARYGVHVLFEAAVCGGIPVILPLKQCLGANRIQSVMGIINGTTNFILTQMTEAGMRFADALLLAQEKGYAEADPSADVDGGDAADKIAILASLAFGSWVDRSQIACEGIRAITDVDMHYAHEWGFVIKLLAIATLVNQQLDIRVQPMLLPKAHPLAGVNSVDNAVWLAADPLGEVMFSGPGAGRGPTASAVVADILNGVAVLKTGVLQPLLAQGFPNHLAYLPAGEASLRFFTRLHVSDRPGVIGALGQAFGDHGVSLEWVGQKGFQGNAAEVVMLTHTVPEAAFRAAMAEIAQLPHVMRVESVLRVLPDA